MTARRRSSSSSPLRGLPPTCRSIDRICPSSTGPFAGRSTRSTAWRRWPDYVSTVTYPNNGFALALRTVAAAIVRGIGTKVFWVQTGGFDTHASQGNAGGGAYGDLMGTFGDGLSAFYMDLRNQGLLNDTLVLQFSEFGRRINENGSQGTDHGAAGLMMAIGGAVRGGIYGTAASLDPNPDNPTLENSGGDVRFETDFRAVYARILDGWLGADSTSLLGGNFRQGSPAVI